MKFFKSLSEYRLFEGVDEEVLLIAKNIIDSSPNKNLSWSFVEEIIKEQVLPELKKILRKNPGYIKPFIKMFLTNGGVTVETLKELYDLIVQYNALIPKLPKPIIQYEVYEELYDDLMALIEKQKSKRIADELPSFLKNELKAASPEIQARFEDLAGKLYKKEDKDTFIKFISKYKSLVDLLDNLEAFVADEFSYSAIMSKIEHTEGAVLHYNNEATGVIVAKIRTYEASQTLGAPSWCIATNKTSWAQYNDTNDLTIQYFTWCTKLPITNPNYLIGCTVSGTEKYKSICDKMNKTISFDEMILVSGLNEKNYPIPNEKNIAIFFKNGDISDKKLRYVFNKFVYRSNFKEVEKIQKIVPEIGLYGMSLPKKLIINSKEDIDNFLKYVRPVDSFYQNSSKDQVLRSILIPAISSGSGNYDLIKSILDYGVDLDEGFIFQIAIDRGVEEYIELISKYTTIGENFFDDLLGRTSITIEKCLDAIKDRITQEEYIRFFTKEAEREVENAHFRMGKDWQKYFKNYYHKLVESVKKTIGPIFGEEVALKPLEPLKKFMIKHDIL